MNITTIAYDIIKIHSGFLGHWEMLRISGVPEKQSFSEHAKRRACIHKLKYIVLGSSFVHNFKLIQS